MGNYAEDTKKGLFSVHLFYMTEACSQITEKRFAKERNF